MKKLKLKIITGFRQDQEYTIDANEAHKAYYLFLNPAERGIFNNGLAIVGSDIKRIEPDYHATMGWNRTHKLDTYDYQELEEKGIDRKMRDIMARAKEIAQTKPDLLDKPLELSAV